MPVQFVEPVQLVEYESCGAVAIVLGVEVNLDRRMIRLDDLENRVIRSMYARTISTTAAIEVRANGGTVTVRGQLPNLRAKWLCLECCRHVAGVNKLIDQLEVRPSSENGPL